MRNLAVIGLIASLVGACVAAPAASLDAPTLTGATSLAAATTTPSSATPSAPSASPTPSPAPLPTQAAWSPPPVPTIAGRDVYTVSRALRARDAGTLGRRTVALGGYWSASSFAPSCPAPMHQTSDLEMYCLEGSFGITEQYESIMTLVTNGMSSTTVGATGPHLTPLIPETLQGRLNTSVAQTPVPIVVTGHFNDARAAACVADVRQVCSERFVIEAILAYDPASAPTPTPSPSPTPFPSPAPSGLFDPTACAGDVPYSFVGWTTSDTLNSSLLPFTGRAFAAVTSDVVPRGTWGQDPNVPGRYNIPMGRLVCVSFEMEPGGIAFGVVRGTAYRLWDDGSRTRDDEGTDSGAGDPSLPAPGSFAPLPAAVRVLMRGAGLADASVAIRDWSGGLVSARPATAAELALPGAATGADRSSGAAVLPGDPRSLLVVWAECGSDRSGNLIVTADRSVVLLVADGRTDCGQPGARRGAVLTFGAAVPSGVTAIAGLPLP